MTTEETLDLALEALKIARDQIVDPEYAPIGWSVSRLDEVLSIGRQARSAPVQEPVDSVQAIGNLMFALTTWKATTSKTAPAAWKKLLQACTDMVATEQPAPVQEPIGYFTVNDYDMWEQIDGTSGKPLYERPAAQRQWVGLTDEERKEIWKGCDPTHAGYVTALVEAKLKERNQ